MLSQHDEQIYVLRRNTGTRVCDGTDDLLAVYPYTLSRHHQDYARKVDPVRGWWVLCRADSNLDLDVAFCRCQTALHRMQTMIRCIALITPASAAAASLVKRLFTPWYKAVIVLIVLLLLTFTTGMAIDYALYKIYGETRLSHSAVLDIDFPIEPMDFAVDYYEDATVYTSRGVIESSTTCSIKERFRFRSAQDLQITVDAINARAPRWGLDRMDVMVHYADMHLHKNTYINDKHAYNFFAQHFQNDQKSEPVFLLHLCEVSKTQSWDW